MKRVQATAAAGLLLAAAAGGFADEPSAEVLVRRALAAAERGPSAAAVELLTRAIAAEENFAPAYYHRGRERFRVGEVEGALADFDRYVELRPAAEPAQWERGIAAYYAGKFAQGAAQFARYQSYDANDVENAVWRYLCMARAEGVETARAEMLPVERDARVPMKEIYELYRGKAEPPEVLAAARAGDPPPEVLGPRLFYAHLYLGLYYESLGEPERAKEHVLLAADEYRIDHYMGDVAALHAKRYREAK